jgi:hypothetical protein
MKNYIKVENNSNLVRDPDSKAILSTNVSGWDAYKKERSERQKIRNMIDEFDTVKNDLNEIKNLLKELLTK